MGERVRASSTSFTDAMPRRCAGSRSVQRFFAPLMVSADWRPYERTLQAGIFASRFPGDGAHAVDTDQSQRICGRRRSARRAACRRHALLRRVERHAARRRGIEGDRATLSVEYRSSRGFACSARGRAGADVEGLSAFLDNDARAWPPCRSRVCRRSWHSCQAGAASDRRRRVPCERAGRAWSRSPPPTFDFVVHGVEIEGYAAGRRRRAISVGGQSAPLPPPPHDDRRRSGSIGRPVTNAQFQAFVDASGYAPADAHNFLGHWRDGAPPAGWENKPVTWVSHRGCARLCRLGGQAPAARMGVAVRRAGRRWPPLSLGRRRGTRRAVPSPSLGRTDAGPARCRRASRRREPVRRARYGRQRLAVDR